MRKKLSVGMGRGNYRWPTFVCVSPDIGRALWICQPHFRIVFKNVVYPDVPEGQNLGSWYHRLNWHLENQWNKKNHTLKFFSSACDQTGVS